jgi:hypothetical protein
VGTYRVLGRPPIYCSCTAGQLARHDAEGPPPSSVPRTPTATDEEIEFLRADAIVAGEFGVVSVCEVAIDGAGDERVAARALVARWLEEKRAGR